MKKVLFLIPTLMHGGAEKVLVNLVNNINKNEFEITVQTLFDEGINKKNLNKEITYKSNFKYIIRGYTYIFKMISPKILYKWLIKDKYDIIISYLEGQTARIVSGCTDRETKLISWIHSEQRTIEFASRAFKSTKEAERSYKKFHKIICVSKNVKKDFEKIFNVKENVEVLYNTNESEDIKQKSKDKVEDIVINKDVFNICSVGKITEEKGYLKLARIHKKLIDNGINNNIYIFGIGEQKEIIERYITENKLDKSFIFMGYKDNPYKYVKNCDLYVCSSEREGFSTAVTEALIIGTPVVTTLCSGMEELLGENDEYGIITKNTEESLYQGIYKILKTDGLLTFYKKKAIERGKVFDTKSTVYKVENMLREI